MTLNEFQKTKEYLICVDSDGCAMDTMDMKHRKCFGPGLVEEWELQQWQDFILKRWNEINLYTATRGVNRFKGLVMMLEEVNEACIKIEDFRTLKTWVEKSEELSNEALKKEIAENNSISLKKALSWSESVNDSINQIPFEEKKPFEGVKEALKEAHEKADIAVVSSANLQAVQEEWEVFDLLEYVRVILTQNVGSKAFCIRELLKKGYDKERVLMIGDAVGDYEAAEKNGVLYYPILVRHEKEAWEEFKGTALHKFCTDKYAGSYQSEKLKAFQQNLQ